ncbi:MAG: DUF2085 domain-containing protein, partial [Thermoproteota archaeon]
ILTLPLWIDSIGQTLGFWISTNDIRLITGLLFGVSLAPLLVYALSILPSSNIPVLKRIKPETAVLDEKDSWFNLKAQAISILLSIMLFLTIRMITFFNFPVFYWIISIPIVFAIVLHFFILPIILIILVVRFITSKSKKPE